MAKQIVLIVADDPGPRQNLVDLLQGEGYQVLAGGTGEEGIALAGSKGVHLALVDFQLPDRPGLEVLEKIKAGHPAAEVILLTGPGTLHAAVAAANRLAFSFLLEPFDADQLLLLVERALEKQRMEEALRMRQRAVESSSNGILIADATLPDRPIVYVNPAFERITGYSAEEALGCNPRFLHQADPEQSGLEEIRIALRDQREGVAVLRNFRKGGDLFWNELSIAPVRDDGGRLTHFIGIINDITECKGYEEQLAYQSNHDGLTGLPNRNLLMDRIRQALLHAQRHRTQAAILSIDLDHFKFINDSLGHHRGDWLLETVAERIGECVRSMDTLARQGGDEFVVVLSDLGQSEHAALVAQKIRGSVSRPLTIEDHDLEITCSIGISLYPKDGRDEQTLLKNAEVAMYRAKEQGRNNYQFYTDELNKKVVARMSMEIHLRRALEREEFLLHYQPQVDLNSGRIVGMEALIRWQSPELGFIPPARFIPLAEETGLIAPIGEWVLETACRQNQAWQDAGLSALTMAINLSPRQFQQENLADRVARSLAETGLGPNYLELEIVESMVMHDVKNASSLTGKLKELGVQLTMDDFGTGYSSLSYLKLFPFDKIKIDQSFVRNITSDPDSAAIARAMIALAHSLKLRVVGEGVETAGQLHYLRSHGCDEMQGFYFSRPVPSGKIEQMLQENRQLFFEEDAADIPERTLLLVDDETSTTGALKRVLYEDGFRILTAASAAEGFEQLAVNRVGLVMADEHMPGMGGTEFLHRVKELYPDTVRIVLTGFADLTTVTDSVNRGNIFKFLTKPWDEERLRENIHAAFRHYLRQTGS
jgi:diguanylate cyclase (GGDEF)-like protein/PAS domain S-box-containing protein